MGTIHNYSSLMQSFYAYACPVKFCVKCALNGPNHGHPFFFQEGNRNEPGKTLRHKIPIMAIYVIIETICKNHGFIFYLFSFIFLFHYFFYFSST